MLLADLIDVARPGEEVEVTGVYVHSRHPEPKLPAITVTDAAAT